MTHVGPIVRCIAVAAAALLTLACQRERAPAPASAPASSAPAAAQSASAPATTAPAPIDGRVRALLDRGPRFSVQLFAAPDAAAANAKLGELQRLGLAGTVVTADLGLRGQWHRVLIGNHGRRDLAELRGRALVADGRVRAQLPPAPAGDPGYVVRDDVAPPVLPAPLLAALARLADRRGLTAVPVWRAANAPPVLALIFEGDPRLRLLELNGTLGEPLPLPRFADCSECLAISAAHRVRAASVLLDEDLDGDGATELLVGFDHGDGQRLVTLVSLAGAGAAGLRELGSLPLGAAAIDGGLDVTIDLVDADLDPDPELLLVRRELSIHEGALCSILRQPMILDLSAGRLRMLDADHFAALAAGSDGDGSARFRAFLRLAQDRADPELALPAAIAYLARASAADAAETVKQLTAFGSGLARPDAALVRIELLVQIAGARPELRSALAPRIEAALVALQRQRSAVPAGCDEAPLVASGWSRDQLASYEPQAQQVRQRNGIWSVPDGVFRSIAAAYPRRSPIGARLDALIAALAPVDSRQRAVRNLVDRVWTDAAAR